MAEEGATLLGTPQQKQKILEGRYSGKDAVEKRSSLIRNSSIPLCRRASLGSLPHGASSGRNSFRSPPPPNNSQNVIPHYLRASMGSCHDVCKYGRKLTFEEKSRLHPSKGIVNLPSNQPIPGGSPVCLERKKVPIVKRISAHDTETHLVKHKPSPHSKTLSSGSIKIVKREVSLPSKKVENFPKQNLATEKKMTKTLRKSDTMSMKHSPSVKPKAPTVKATPFSDTSGCRISLGRRNSITNDGRGKVAWKNSFERVQGTAEFSSSSGHSVGKTMSSKSRKYKSSNLVSPLKDRNRIERGAIMKQKNEKIHGKTLHVVKPKTASNIFESLQNGRVAASFAIPSDHSQACVCPPNVSLSPHEEDQVNDERGGRIGGEEETGRSDEEASELSDNNDRGNLNKKEPEEDCNRTSKKGSAVEEEERVEEKEETGHSNTEANELGDSDVKANLNEGEPAEGDCNRTLNKSRATEEEEETVETNNEATELPENNYKANLNEKENAEDNCNGTSKKGRTAEEEEEDRKDNDDDKDEEKSGPTNSEASELTDNNNEANLNEKEPEGNFSGTSKKGRALEEEDEDEEDEEEMGEEEQTGNTNNEGSELMDSNDKANMNEKEPAKCNFNRTSKKGLAVVAKDKDSLLMKLKFRRGKVVELHSEDNIPRRLRFRRGRVLGENSDSKAGAKKNFKKRVVDGKDGTNPSSETVVLRHQDVLDNKNTQGLFNNVIEETASKLVESRKSKVRALVGAFETVISLQ